MPNSYSSTSVFHLLVLIEAEAELSDRSVIWLQIKVFVVNICRDNLSPLRVYLALQGAVPPKRILIEMLMKKSRFGTEMVCV